MTKEERERKEAEVIEKLTSLYYEQILFKIDRDEEVRRSSVLFAVNTEDETDDGLYVAFHTIAGPKNVLSVGGVRIGTITDADPLAGRKLARVLRKLAYTAETAAKKKDH
jgi:hypothetical protein